MNIAKGAGESLVGRIKIHRLFPFTFREYLMYHGMQPQNIKLDNIKYPDNASEYKIEFKKYMERGGLPELYEESSPELLNQIPDLVFFRDIVEIFSVKRTEVLKGIFREIAEHSGQIVNYSNMENDLNTQYRTIKDYIQYLQDSCLIEKSTPFEESHLKSLRKNPKMYSADHSFTALRRT